jgi:hypothetical protein
MYISCPEERLLGSEMINTHTVNLLTDCVELFILVSAIITGKVKIVFLEHRVLLLLPRASKSLSVAKNATFTMKVLILCSAPAGIMFTGPTKKKKKNP